MFVDANEIEIDPIFCDARAQNNYFESSRNSDLEKNSREKNSVLKKCVSFRVQKMMKYVRHSAVNSVIFHRFRASDKIHEPRKEYFKFEKELDKERRQGDAER